MVRAALAVVLLAVTAGCEPSWTVRGQVVRQALSATGRSPLAGAQVTLTCDGGRIEQTAVADERGGFQLDGPGQGPRFDCELAVAMNGFAPRSYTIDQICADADETSLRCSGAALQAELVPER